MDDLVLGTISVPHGEHHVVGVVLQLPVELVFAQTLAQQVRIPVPELEVLPERIADGHTITSMLDARCFAVSLTGGANLDQTHRPLRGVHAATGGTSGGAVVTRALLVSGIGCRVERPWV